MENKLSKLPGIVIIVFVLMMCVLTFDKAVFYSVMNASSVREVQEPETEKGIFGKIDAVTEKLEQSLSENVIFLKALQKADILYTYRVSGQLCSTQVFEGRHHWLFYSGEDSLADYSGMDFYTSAFKTDVAQKIRLVRDRMNSDGIQLMVLLAPNKENVYTDYVPERIRHSDISRKNDLVAYLTQEQLPILDLQQELVDNKGKYQVYYAYDTHWNQIGGFLGTRAVLEKWGISTVPLEERSITAEPLKKHYHNSAESDLAQMVNLRDEVFNDDSEYMVSDTYPIDWNIFEAVQSEQGWYMNSNENAQVDKTLLLVGDSFRYSMLPALCSSFKTVYVVHQDNFTADMLLCFAPDYVIAEYVERYSSRLENIDQLFYGSGD